MGLYSGMQELSLLQGHNLDVASNLSFRNQAHHIVHSFYAAVEKGFQNNFTKKDIK
jgi:hypothetical protein